MKRHQELENKATALKRESDIQRASVRQYKEKMQQLHELLASREQEHRYNRRVLFWRSVTYISTLSSFNKMENMFCQM